MEKGYRYSFNNTTYIFFIATLHPFSEQRENCLFCIRVLLLEREYSDSKPLVCERLKLTHR